MKVPRDISGKELAKRLSRFGYKYVRQTGSHMRLSSTFNGDAHLITIPDHATLKVGTLSAILSDIAT